MIYQHKAGNLDVGCKYRITAYELGSKEPLLFIATFMESSRGFGGNDRLTFRNRQYKYVIREDDVLAIEAIGTRDFPLLPSPDSSDSGTSEADPDGLQPSDAGAKLDAGKIYADSILAGFPHALWGVADVGTFGAKKYSLNGWVSVKDGIRRYRDAAARHRLKRQMGELTDPESGLLHEFHEAWNVLAALELTLTKEK